MKADKLRPIANKFLHSLNESPLTNNVQVRLSNTTLLSVAYSVLTFSARRDYLLYALQIYKYEAQMLRLLQYDVGDLPNPLRVRSLCWC